MAFSSAGIISSLCFWESRIIPTNLRFPIVTLCEAEEALAILPCRISVSPFFSVATRAAEELRG